MIKNNLPAVGVSNTCDAGQTAKRVKTQKVLSDLRLILRDIGFYLMWGVSFVFGPLILFNPLSTYLPDEIKVGITDAVYVFTLAWFFLSVYWMCREKTRYEPLSAKDISELYAIVSIFPEQKQIIKDAVMSNFTLRNRDLQFALALKNDFDNAVAKREEDNKRQMVLSAIKQDGEAVAPSKIQKGFKMSCVASCTQAALWPKSASAVNWWCF